MFKGVHPCGYSQNLKHLRLHMWWTTHPDLQTKKLKCTIFKMGK